MDIRKADESDRTDIAFVFADAFSHDWKVLSTDTAKVARALAKGHKIDKYTVAEINNRVVAFLAFTDNSTRAFEIPIKEFQKEFGFFKGYMVGMALKSDMEREIPLNDNSVYIDIVGVCKEYQHKGIASALIDYVVNNYDYSSYLLSVTNINTNAIECYRKKGFKEYKRERVKFAKQKGFSEYIYLEYLK